MVLQELLMIIENMNVVNSVKKLLKRNNDTGDVARKEGFGRPKFVRTEENTELILKFNIP